LYRKIFIKNENDFPMPVGINFKTQTI
jgi:hypothetical protein